MLKFFILLWLSNFLSAELADSKYQNVTSAYIDKNNSEGCNKSLKLKTVLNLLSSSDEVQRVRLEEISLRMEQQTQIGLEQQKVLDEILSKLSKKSDSDSNIANNNGHEEISLRMEQQMKVLDEILSKLSTKSDSDSNVANNNDPRVPSSCAEATTVNSESGIYSILVPSFSAQTFLVYCNAEEQGGGWTVIQRRVDDSVDFYRDWAEYKIGFGNLEGNFFIGLDKLHALTYAAPQELLIILTDFENITKHAKYDSFAIGDESETYALNVLGKYSGDAGDSLTYHQGMKFSTKDKDNDATAWNCAEYFRGAWWYLACHQSNLNGLYLKGAFPEDKYGQGINWIKWHGHYYSLKTVNMMIRPKRN